MIRGETREETMRIAHKKRERMARQDRKFVFRELDPFEPHVVRMKIRPDKKTPDEITDLLHRETAKAPKT